MDDDDIEYKASLNLIYFATRKYFEFPWARNYKEEREMQYGHRVFLMIVNALKSGKLPPRLMVHRFIPADNFYRKAWDKYRIEGLFQAVMDYYEELVGMPYELRFRKHQEKINNATG